MSSLAPPPVASALTNETLKEPSSPPPQPIDETPTPPALASPAPLVSPPSPPASASNSTSEPPSSLKQDESPPPSLSPPAPPPDNSPLAPAPSSSSVSRPPPPTLNRPPSLSAPPPPQASNHSASVTLPAAPAQLAPASSDSPPASQDNPPPSLPSPVTSLPTSGSSLVTPPPDAGTPSLSTNSQPLFPPAPEEPVDSPVSPTLPETPPLTSIPSPSTPITPAKPTPSTTPGIKSPSSVSQLVPPSTHTSPSSSSNTPKTSDDVGSGTVLGFTVAGVVLIFVAIFFVIFRKKRRVDDLGHQYRPPSTFSVNSDGYYKQVNQIGNSKGSDIGNTGGSYRGYASHGGPSESVGLGGSKTWFTYEEITDITHGFSRENLLGEGGFGCVYKGWLPDGKVVAVKQLKSGSGQGEREFRAEVEIISRVHHRHLVSLVGYCIAGNQRSLVYEFVPNNTLEHHLHGKGLPVIDWPNRLKIAIGSARGLAYLHEDCHPRIIHRDIKSANILLDNIFEAQVADFGLAKLSNDTYTHVSTRVMGTFGYMAPEYASSGKLTDRSDVFSFGVVLLELITGRKPVDPSQPLGEESLVEWARPRLVHALETEDFEGLADPRLENNYVKSEMFRMLEAAASCVRHSAPKRPRMMQVLRALDNEGELTDLSNGLKFGQSTVYESRQYSADIQKFQRMAFGSGHYSSDYGQSGEYDCTSSGGSDEHRTRDAPHKPLHPWKAGELGSGKYGSSHHSEPRGISRHGSERNFDGSHRSNMRGYF